MWVSSGQPAPTHHGHPCSRAHLSIARCGPRATCLYGTVLQLPCSCAHRTISMPPPKRAPPQVLSSHGQGLALVQYSAQPKPIFSLKLNNYSQAQVLTLN
jgi:hypothetical protein